MEDSYEKEKRLYFIVDGSVLMHFVFGFCAGRRHCVKKKYYFFRQVGGAGGYMKKSTKVNGIRLKKNGTASYNKQQLCKLKLMVLASSEVDRCTNNKNRTVWRNEL